MEMLTVSQAAKSLGVTPALIRIYIRNNLFPGAEKVRGTRWRIPRAAVELFDGTEVAGSFSKQPKKEPGPFCIVKKVHDLDNMPSFGCFVNKGSNMIQNFLDKKIAENFAARINDAAEQWAKENYGA